jgi:hypothetical protein
MQARNSVAAIAVVFIGLGFASFLGGSVHSAQAQTSQPQFLMTWQASNSYAPAEYSGKILPNQESEITASFEVIVNGKPVNLSGQTIYWYQDENLLGGGVGDQTFMFHPYGQAPNIVTLKVEVPDYPTGLLIHEINIPLVQPQAVIEAPYPQDVFSSIPTTVQALPYFFAATSTDPLSFAWTVNGQTVSGAENPQTLQVSLPQSTPAGFSVDISLAVQNSNDSTGANNAVDLTYQRQP